MARQEILALRSVEMRVLVRIGRHPPERPDEEEVVLEVQDLMAPPSVYSVRLLAGALRREAHRLEEGRHVHLVRSTAGWYIELPSAT